MGNRINTVMQPCFFSLSGVLPADEAIAAIKASVEKAYGKRGQTVVERNFAAIDASLAGLARVRGARRGQRHPPPAAARAGRRRPTSCSGSPRVMLAGDGDLLPGQRAARSTAPSRRAPPGTRSGPSPPRSRSGTPTSASTAASAPSSARTPPSA